MKRGWCPGVHEPMATGDGLLIRVKPFGGRLSADALRTLAVVAAGCGNGAVELTGRGNIQLRGLTEVTAPLAASALVQAGLADPDPVREARRNVIAVPPCDDALVAATEASMAATEGLAAKFCLVVSGGRVLESLSALGGGEGWVRWGAERGRGPLLVGLPFGQTDAAGVMRLADLVGGSTVRTTPWRAFLIEGAHDPAPFAASGFITGADDARRFVTACVGAPFCARASVPARADAAMLAARGVRGVHVSGCAKGCGQNGAATTLVGTGGAYGLVRHGRAGDRPSVTGLTIAQAAEMLA
jgi:precorrin-3B synthase